MITFFAHLDELRRFGGYYVHGSLRPLPRYYTDLLQLVDRTKITLSEFESKFDKYYRRCADFGIEWNIFRPPSFDVDTVFHNDVAERESLTKSMFTGI